VPKDAKGKFTVRITYDLGPAGGKVVGKKEIELKK
jgi:hypothetical protein